MSELSKTRHALLEALAELSQAYPDMRFGQMICMLSYMGTEGKISDAYDIEDGDLLLETMRLIVQAQVTGTTSYRLVPQAVPVAQ